MHKTYQSSRKAPQRLQCNNVALAHHVIQNTSRDTKSDGGYQAIHVVQFDIRRSILLTREKQESHFFWFWTFQI